MRALGIRRFDGPDALEPIELSDPACGRREVVLDVATVGVNRLDLAVLRGKGPGAAATLPLIPGVDPAGTVTRVGPDVDRLEIGDRVAAKPNIACRLCRHCLNGEPWACTRQKVIGVHIFGGYAPSIALPAVNAVKIPPTTSFEEATAAVHTFPVALRMLKQAGSVSPGQTVLVIGGAGSVGSAAVQLCRFFGAEVIGIVSGEDKARYLEELGARPIDVSRQDLRLELESIGSEVTMIVDTAGDPELTMPAIDILGWRGTYVTCGSHGGGQIEVDLGSLYRNRQSLIGSSASGYDDVTESFSLLGQGAIRARVSQVRPLDEAKEAFGQLTSRANIGKIVLRHD